MTDPILLPQIQGLSIIEDDYFLPEGGPAAKERFLLILQNVKEAWISAYGFTLQPMFDEIIKADNAGAKFHILLDHSQETGRAEAPLVANLCKTMKNSDVTVTTAGVNSGKPSAIYHWKAMVIVPADDGDPQEGPICWEGSTNFSGGAWDQGNSARVFRSVQWSEIFISKFSDHRDWAHAHEPQYQVDIKS